MLVLDKISVAFPGKKVLDKCSCSFEAGSITTILGNNGAGKTTLFKCILGEIVYSGDATVDDKSICLKDVGYLPQKFEIDADVNARVIELLVRSLQVKNNAFFHAKRYIAPARKLLGEVGIAHLENSMIGNLSGGQAQIVRIALALVNKPKVLLLDEPLSFLDVPNKLIVMRALKKITCATNMRTVIISHDLLMAKKMSDCIFGLRNGCINVIRKKGAKVCELGICKTLGINKCAYAEYAS